MEDLPILVILLCLLVLSGIFSGSEAALLSLESQKVRTLCEKKARGSSFLSWLKNNPQKLIITILIGNNLVNIVLPVLTTVWATHRFGDASLGVVTGVLTFLLLVFGEIIPKNFAVAHRETFALLVSPFIYFLAKILFPVVWIFEKLSNFFTPQSKDSKAITEEEVLAMVSMGEEHGEITAEEKDRIEGVLELSDTLVSEIMTPRTDIAALEETENVASAITFIREHQFSRIPIYRNDIDNVVGLLKIRDVLQSPEENEYNRMIKNIETKSPFFVPITKKVAELMEDFKRLKVHMAIVVDEHGGTAGLVTMEDILEEIFGEIQDETDEEEELIRKINDNTWVAPPNVTVQEVYDETGVLLDPDKASFTKNISLIILEVLERFPRRGESITFPGGMVVVERMGARRVERVRIYPLS